jgi:hypothetical protein
MFDTFFFLWNRRSLTPYWNYVKQSITSTGTVSRKEIRNKEGQVLAMSQYRGEALHLWIEWEIPLKITSFHIVQIDQDIVMIISMKKDRWSWVLKLSKMKQGSSELGTVSCREDQHAIEKATGPHLHLNGREHKCTLADAYVAFWGGLLCWVDPLKEARRTFGCSDKLISIAT